MAVVTRKLPGSYAEVTRKIQEVIKKLQEIILKLRGSYAEVTGSYNSTPHAAALRSYAQRLSAHMPMQRLSAHEFSIYMHSQHICFSAQNV